jgi:hypothetical protein
MANRWERNTCCQKRGDTNVLFKAPTPRAVITERAEPSHTGLRRDKPCLVTVVTRAYMNAVRPDIGDDDPRDI